MNGGLSQNIVVSTFCGSPSFFLKMQEKGEEDHGEKVYE